MSVPLSLYIHIPWCVKKCPYCDFNSHALKDALPQAQYVDALCDDMALELPYVQERPIQSIFFGGGTPSLFAPSAIEQILTKIATMVKFADDIEITLEVNPGTIEHHNLADYKQAGINRISLGAQSFDDAKLQLLGRIHKAEETLRVIDELHQVNFNSFNLDLMYGLPQQSVTQALSDLEIAIASCAPHISWYHLTIEPNTLFYKYPPVLPDDELTFAMQTEGHGLLTNAGLIHYEVSAYAKSSLQCRHNLNYWEFGDYIGIGAGAHGKITELSTGNVSRRWKTRNPKDYLDPNQPFLAGTTAIPSHAISGEYMLNRLRLFTKLKYDDYQTRTGLPISSIAAKITHLANKELLLHDADNLYLTALGKRFLNDVLQEFLVE